MGTLPWAAPRGDLAHSDLIKTVLNESNAHRKPCGKHNVTHTWMNKGKLF